MLRYAPHRAAGLAAALLSTGLLAGCGSDEPQEPSGPSGGDSAQAGSPEAEAAAGWLAARLQDGLVSSSYQDPKGKWITTPDAGLSLDIALALQEVDGFEDERSRILAAVEEQVDTYVGSGKDQYAGPLGKLVTAVQAEGTDPAEYADGDLVTRLEGLVVTTGPEEGRAKDTWSAGNEFGADYSNAIGQSYVVRGLAGAGSDLADEAAGFLLQQQCEDGFFRVPMDSEDFTCDGGTAKESTPSTDATAFAVLALAEAVDAGVDGLGSEADPALERARTWLLAQQDEDGAFADTEGGVPNVNSTGMAAEALAVLGEDDAAAAAARWVAERQVTDDAAEGTDLADHVGAVAYDEAALESGADNGITRATRGQWVQATAQAVGALTELGSSS